MSWSAGQHLQHSFACRSTPAGAETLASRSMEQQGVLCCTQVMMPAGNLQHQGVNEARNIAVAVDHELPTGRHASADFLPVAAAEATMTPASVADSQSAAEMCFKTDIGTAQQNGGPHDDVTSAERHLRQLLTSSSDGVATSRKSTSSIHRRKTDSATRSLRAGSDDLLVDSALSVVKLGGMMTVPPHLQQLPSHALQHQPSVQRCNSSSSNFNGDMRRSKATTAAFIRRGAPPCAAHAHIVSQVATATSGTSSSLQDDLQLLGTAALQQQRGKCPASTQ